MTMDRAEYERVLGVALRLASTDDLDAVLSEIVDAMRDVLRAERASVFVRAADGSFEAVRAHGLARSFRVRGDTGVIARAAGERRVVNVADVSRDAGFNASVDAETGFTTRCLLAVPMVDAGGEVVGVVQVLNKLGGDGGGVFGALDEAVASHLAAQAGVAIGRARLMEAARRRDALEAEVAAARAMQRSAMPAVLPVMGGWSVDAAWSPAGGLSSAAGDVYDAVEDGDRVVVMVGDASGHGVGPAVSVSRAQAMFRVGVGSGMGVVEIAGMLNARLGEDLPTGHFVTAFFGEVRRGEGVVRYVSAGQSPLLGCRRLGDRVEELAFGLPPLGVEGWSAGRCVAGAFGVEAGGGVLVATDGVYGGGEGGDGGGLGVARVGGLVFGEGVGAAGVIGACGGVGADDRTVLVLRRGVG